MPRFIAESLRAGLRTFGRRMRGFVTGEAVVVGVESRTSTPVRVPRDPATGMHPEVRGLFPTGEGGRLCGRNRFGGAGRRTDGRRRGRLCGTCNDAMTEWMHLVSR